MITQLHQKGVEGEDLGRREEGGREGGRKGERRQWSYLIVIALLVLTSLCLRGGMNGTDSLMRTLRLNEVVQH